MDNQQPKVTLETPLGLMVIEVQPHLNLSCRIPVVRRIHGVWYAVRVHARLDPRAETWDVCDESVRVQRIQQAGVYVPDTPLHDDTGHLYAPLRQGHRAATSAAQAAIVAQLQPVIEHWAEHNASIFSEANTASVKGRAQYLADHIASARRQIEAMTARIERIQAEIVQTGSLNGEDHAWLEDRIGRKLSF